MKNILLSIVLVTTFATAPLAHTKQQESAFLSKTNKAQSEKIKASLQEKLAKINGFSASFTQKVIDAEKQVIAQGEGNLSVEKPNKVNWHTTSPDETLIIANGETLWFYDPFIEQVSVYHFEQALANTPILLLSNDDKSLWDGYRVLQVESSFVIESLDEQSHVKALQLKFNGDTLTDLVIFDSTGQISEIALTMISNTSQDSNQYEFVIPDGTHIDDQRE